MLKQKHFLKLLDYTPAEIQTLLDLAASLKAEKKNAAEQPRLTGKNIALIFEKTSTRTRCAFEVAAHDQGAHVTYLDSSGSQIGHKESIRDTARVLGRMYDAIEYRGYGQEIVEQLAEYAGVPVINGLTNEYHPTQMLADLLTMKENSKKPLNQIAYAYVGDARYNMGNSLLVAGAKMGMDVRIGAPRAFWPNDALVEQCRSIAKQTGARITLTEDAAAAVDQADFIHTDVWVSMGEAKETWKERIEQLRPYRVDARLMAASNNPEVKFMHCLPAIHNRDTQVGQWLFNEFSLDGAEVSEEVFESVASIVFEQAENRMHTIKAVLVALLTT
ncbi:ornithine carbamoyltransferase [Snodgrassella alvi]|uniref:Ornithine carbamoyltransferase n=2 Tax=Neisseriaceae TaxID=481 RepID=A0ABD7Z5N8_9NEIS|nr:MULTISPECIES: ornithine carbamoyltransferase [Snodgrassella]MBI0128789.1 ornithine carbamoyltransferase [Snodgrassella sp. W8124]MBI0132238.1 ornithine carbamoyltransferase [Snodgrassella sp. W8132]MBI0158394.1 ornithine carbamoyltransferase [Snodgrassella sp. W6238H11]MBI0161019.1 ornithine carbamoyltransferase [Snodgrassella sp. W6238H14]MBI0165652.1 ornithine carbamoyltransferase [Snodgrassella sp. M0351]